jgi:hypothetical protein
MTQIKQKKKPQQQQQQQQQQQHLLCVVEKFSTAVRGRYYDSIFRFII